MTVGSLELARGLEKVFPASVLFSPILWSTVMLNDWVTGGFGERELEFFH